MTTFWLKTYLCKYLLIKKVFVWIPFDKRHICVKFFWLKEYLCEYLFADCERRANQPLLSIHQPWSIVINIYFGFCGTFFFRYKYSEFIWKVAADWRSAHNLLTFIWKSGKVWLKFWHISLYPLTNPNFCKWKIYTFELWYLSIANMLTNLHLPSCIWKLPEVDKFEFGGHECHASCETEICK